jgi:uncharacterized RDD family membrane protein YckC
VNPIPQEARLFQGRQAGLVTRAAAAGIDVGVVMLGLIVIYLGVVVVIFLVPPGGAEWPAPPGWLGLTAGPVVMTLYLAASWHRGGRTYGCHVMGVRVTDRRGRDPGLLIALLRAAFTVAFPLGLAWVAFSRRNRSVQDVVLVTSVIYDWGVRPRVVVAPAGRPETVQPVRTAPGTGQPPSHPD